MKVAIIGYGKMGREIEALLIARGHQVPIKIDMDNQADFTQANMGQVDVAIEFTAPDTAYENVIKCLNWGVPVVSGSTGWNDKLELARELCVRNNGTFFYASNYGIGVNIFFKLNEILARMMNGFPEYEVSLKETHHIQKKDSPSGTAVTLAEGIMENMDRKMSWVNHESLDETAVGIVSVREGAVAGIHEVHYESGADMIDIVHTSKNRSGLAMGAVLAAEFTRDHKGLLSMDDMMRDHFRV